jgi:predicted transcriptional regulator
LTNGEVDYLVSLMDEGGLITRWSDFTIKSITWKGYDLLSEFERWQS